ncbi:MAG: MutS-related protein, partial [Vulcanimicrobiaceae bacterium]
MSRGDKYLYEIAGKAVLSSETDQETLRYRQAILRDCLSHQEIVRAIYDMVVEASEGYRRHFWLGRSASSTLWGGVGMLEFFVDMLRKLRGYADQYGNRFASDGLRSLFAMLRDELSDPYFLEVEAHLRQLKFRDGVLISAQLADGNKGIDYVLRRPKGSPRHWLERLFVPGPEEYTYQLHPRDDAGARALSTLRDRGVNLVANAAAQSADHILSFLRLLRAELGFYVGCLNLHADLSARGRPACFPEPIPIEERVHAFRELYDVALALTISQDVVGNELDARGNDVAVITGANRGGKSVFLRSIGLAQLMTQCGMFVGAESFTANVSSAVFTHFKREEDRTMESGKFDEELTRISDIADRIKPNALMLFNESFAATNDREGSEIARQIVSALLEKRIKVFFVTHLTDFSQTLFEQRIGCPKFLRAERLDDGRRTYKLVEAEPLETSYGADLYRQIFLTSSAQYRSSGEGESDRRETRAR